MNKPETAEKPRYRVIAVAQPLMIEGEINILASQGYKPVLFESNGSVWTVILENEQPEPPGPSVYKERGISV